MGQKQHVLSSASLNLKSSFLVNRILCKSLNENCLSLLSLVERYINKNLFFHSEYSSAKLIYPGFDASWLHCGVFVQHFIIVFAAHVC